MVTRKPGVLQSMESQSWTCLSDWTALMVRGTGICESPEDSEQQAIGASGNKCCLNWLKGQSRFSVFYPWWPTECFHQRRWKIYKHDLGWMIMNLILELVGLGYWPKEAKIGGKYKGVWAFQVVLVVKNPCRRHKKFGFDPWVGKIPWRKACQPTPVFLPGQSHGQRSLAGYSAWSCRESDTTEATQHACMH